MGKPCGLRGGSQREIIAMHFFPLQLIEKQTHTCVPVDCTLHASMRFTSVDVLTVQWTRSDVFDFKLTLFTSLSFKVVKIKQCQSFVLPLFFRLSKRCLNDVYFLYLTQKIEKLLKTKS